MATIKHTKKYWESYAERVRAKLQKPPPRLRKAGEEPPSRPKKEKPASADWVNDPPSAEKMILDTTQDAHRDAHGRLLKGHSGNLAGMPPGTPRLGFALKKRLAQHPQEVDELVEAVIKLAMMGDMRAMELLWDRIDGKVIERHLIEGEMPVTIQFVPATRLITHQPEEIETKPMLALPEPKGELAEAIETSVE